MPEKQVVVRLKGGLGNQLFQYALGRQLSMLLDAELLLDCSFLENRVSIPHSTHRAFELGAFTIQARLATENDIPPAFFVFSDDIAWCKQYLQLKDYAVIFVENEEPSTKADFYLMTHCKHFIIANSTFSWWAAWLSVQGKNKFVVAPKHWFAAAIDTSNLIPEGWMQV